MATPAGEIIDRLLRLPRERAVLESELTLEFVRDHAGSPRWRPRSSEAFTEIELIDLPAERRLMLTCSRQKPHTKAELFERYRSVGIPEIAQVIPEAGLIYYRLFLGGETILFSVGASERLVGVVMVTEGASQPGTSPRDAACG